MPKPVFFDPQRKRWKRIRRIIDITVVTLTALIVFFIVTIMSGTSIPKLLLQDQKKPYHALKQKESKHPVRRGTHRKSKLAPSQVVLNQAEGIRGAFYVTWDAASFSSPASSTGTPMAVSLGCPESSGQPFRKTYSSQPPAACEVSTATRTRVV